jgi:hypothetical protein
MCPLPFGARSTGARGAGAASSTRNRGGAPSDTTSSITTDISSHAEATMGSRTSSWCAAPTTGTWPRSTAERR